MVVHIAPIGRETKHVEEWLREVTPVTKIWLIHSKKKDGNVDFNKHAKDLEKKLKNDYTAIEIQHKIIDNPFGMDDTMDAITEIVTLEEENDVLRQEFAINVTGGTNVMASGAILQAMLLGTKAYYVLNRDKNPGQKSYVEELPIPSIGIAKMNDIQQEILNIVSEEFFRLPGRKGIKKIEEGPGVITNQKLLQILEWEKKTKAGKDARQKRIRQKGATRLTAIMKKLEEKGYVEIIRGVPENKLVPGFGETGGDKYIQKINQRAIKYKITPAGRRQARNSMMLKE